MSTSEAPAITLHLMTQDGQPYGSQRRCCEMCGVMIWNDPPSDGGEWTDDRRVYQQPPIGYVRCDSLKPKGGGK